MRARLSAADDVVQDGEFPYSNLVYCLVGLFLELAYDTVFEELLRQKLFSPLGLDTAAFGPPAWINRHQQPWGHRAGRPVISAATAENPLALSPAGTVCMSLTDMTRYLRFVMSGGRVLEQSNILRLLDTELSGGFARGWLKMNGKWCKGTYWITIGSNGSFFTLFSIAPSIEFGLALSTNTGDQCGQNACQELLDLILDNFASAV